MNQAFSGEDCVQDLDTAMHSKNFELASSSDPQTAFEDYLLPPTAIAQMRWTKVKEEVEISQRKLLDIMKQNCGNEATTSESRSLQVNFIDNLCHPEFSGAGIEGEDCSSIQVALDDTHIEQPRSYDGEASSSGLANVHYPASLPWTDSPNGPKFLASGEIGEFDYTQQCAASPNTFSVWDEYGLVNLDNMGLRFDQALSFPDQVTSSLVCDLDPMKQAFCDEDYLQFFTTARMR